eukprot:CAMPEP_0179014052 /NCGR_PEP_ID=MMETSP0796-20121207/2049_1 /TAXON_ID=73915 /ORGANISM="Pyrodinium bahamense, Strain pbaha01" /LENGTH=434 /DNA_ID=CAMNT_0020709587 /DNA_START=63 /DNA_END=1367 /DNA_ORIENTATION=+
MAVDAQRGILRAAGDARHAIRFRSSRYEGSSLSLQLQDGRNVGIGHYGLLQVSHSASEFVVERVPEASLLQEARYARMASEAWDAAEALKCICDIHRPLRAPRATTAPTTDCLANVQCCPSAQDFVSANAGGAAGGVLLLARLGGHDVLAALAVRMVELLAAALREPHVKLNDPALRGFPHAVLEAFERVAWNAGLVDVEELAQEMRRFPASFWDQPRKELRALGLRLLGCLSEACGANKLHGAEHRQVIEQLSGAAVRMICHSCQVLPSCGNFTDEGASSALLEVAHATSAPRLSDSFKDTLLRFQAKDSGPQVLQVVGPPQGNVLPYLGRYVHHEPTVWLHEAGRYSLVLHRRRWMIRDSHSGSYVLSSKEYKDVMPMPHRSSGLWRRGHHETGEYYEVKEHVEIPQTSDEWFLTKLSERIDDDDFAEFTDA